MRIMNFFLGSTVRYSMNPSCSPRPRISSWTVHLAANQNRIPTRTIEMFTINNPSRTTTAESTHHRISAGSNARPTIPNPVLSKTKMRLKCHIDLSKRELSCFQQSRCYKRSLKEFQFRQYFKSVFRNQLRSQLSQQSIELCPPQIQ